MAASEGKLIVAYLRVSTDAQTTGNGLAQQRAEISAYAAFHGIEIDEWVADAATGTSGSRESLDLLKLQASSGKLGRIIIDRMDRLARDLAVSEALYLFFKTHGVEIVFVQQSFSDTVSGTLMRQMCAAIAQYQKSELLIRMRACKQAALKNGKFIGGGVPFGYRKGVSPGVLEIDEKAARTVRYIFELYSLGMSSVKIAAKLNEMGYTAAKGGKFHNPAVLDIVKRLDFYRGRTTLHRTSISTTAPVHPPILTTGDLHMNVRQSPSA